MKTNIQPGQALAALAASAQDFARTLATFAAESINTTEDDGREIAGAFDMRAGVDDSEFNPYTGGGIWVHTATVTHRETGARFVVQFGDDSGAVYLWDNDEESCEDIANRIWDMCGDDASMRAFDFYLTDDTARTSA